MSAKEREEWYNGPVGMSKKGLEEFRKRVINEEIKKCEVDLVWDPPWSPDMMSEEAQTMLGMELNRPMLDGTRAGGDGGWE